MTGPGDRAARMADEDPFRVVFFGTSNVIFSETGPDETLPRLAERELLRLAPERRWLCIPEQLPPARDMADRAVRLVLEHEAGAAYLSLSASFFVYEQVIDRVRRRWPRLHSLIARPTFGLKEAAGGRFSGDEGMRGLLFRVPQRLAEVTIGVDPLVRPEHATSNMRETVRRIATETDAALVFRKAFASPKPFSRNPEKYTRILNAYNEAVAQECDSNGVLYYDLPERMRLAGRVPTQVADGVHQDLQSRQFEAGVAAEMVLLALKLKRA